MSTNFRVPTFYKNGQIKYINNDKGIFSFYESGRVKSEYLKNPETKIAGNVYKDWYENGQLKTLCTTDEIETLQKVEDTTWYENGQKYSCVKYKATNDVFEETSWYDNGQIKYEKMINSQKNEIIKSWFKTGQLRFIKKLKFNFGNHGVMDVIFEEWYDETGILVIAPTQIFESGIPYHDSAGYLLSKEDLEFRYAMEVIPY